MRFTFAARTVKICKSTAGFPEIRITSGGEGMER